jgi:hypothetical protein
MEQLHLPFEAENDALEMNCVKTACRELSALWNGISQGKIFCAVEFGRICKCLISLHLCMQCTTYIAMLNTSAFPEWILLFFPAYVC